MNKRARNRLIGVTAIILVAAVAIIMGTGSKDGAYYRTVEEVATSNELVGERVRVGGAVVAGSWDRKSNPMRFEIRDESDESASGPTIKVVYNGGVPSTFGDGVTAIVTGTLSDDGVIESQDMITKCPSKYETEAGALSVESLLKASDTMNEVTTKITGFVVAGTIAPPGGDVRFEISSIASGGDSVGVAYEGALPEGMADGSQVVIQGALEDGVFVATSVALAESEKR